MKASPLTEGLLFAIELLLLEGQDGAAQTLVRGCGISIFNREDRAVIQKMKADGALVFKGVIPFIRKHGAKPTPAARRKVVRS